MELRNKPVSHGSPRPVSGDWIARPFSIIFIAAGLFVVILGIAIFLGFRQAGFTKQNVLNVDNTTAVFLADILVAHNKATLEILQSYARRPLFIDAVKSKNLTGTYRHLSDLKKNDVIDRIFVTDPHGILWANLPFSPESVGKNLSYRDWYKGISSNWRPYTSTVFKLIVGDRPLATAVCVPIFDEKERVIGILGSSRRLSHTVDAIERVPFPPHATVNVIDQAGQILYSNKTPYQETVVKYRFFPAVRAALEGKERQLEVSDPQKAQEKRHLTVAPVETPGWSVVIERTTADIYRLDFRQFAEIGIVSFLLFLLIISALVYLRRTSLFRKTEALLQAEIKLREGAEALRKSEVRFRELFNRMISGAAVYEARGNGEDFIFKDINPAGERISQVKRKEVLGRSVLETFPGVRDIGLFEVFQRVWRTGTTEDHPVSFYRDERISQWVENTVYRLPSGEIVAVYTDITERKKIEEDLRHSEERFRSTLDNMLEGCQIIGFDWRYVYLNSAACAHARRPKEELLGKRYMDMWPGAEATEIFNIIKRCMEERIPHRMENEFVFSDGAIGWFDLSIQPVDEGVFILSIDITEHKRAKDALLKSEEKFRTIFDRASDGILIADAATKEFLQGNTAICSMLGYTKEELEGLAVPDIHPEEDLPHVLDEFEKLAKGEKTLAEDLLVLRKDGSIFYADVAATDTTIGGRQYLVGIFRDTTERRQAEEALRKSEKKYRNLFDNANEAIFVAQDDMLVFVNPMSSAMTGYSGEELMSRSFMEFVHPDDRDTVLGNHMKRMKGEELPHRYSFRIIHKDGGIRWGEMNTVLIQWNGKTATLNFMSDITERNLAEEAIRDSEAKYHDLIEQAGDAIFVVDRKGNILLANKKASEIINCTQEELLKMNIAETFLAEQRDFAIKRISSLRKGEHLRYERDVLRKDGTVFPVEVSIGSLPDDTVQGIMHDITERKQAEEKLQQTLDSLRNAVSTTIQVIGSTVETRDPYTAAHQLRSADLARAIATEMNLSKDKIEGIRMAGLIHDLGKLSVPAEILSKPTKLTEIEFSLIKEHPGKGYDILKNVESPWPLAEIVFQHHERMDGSGYPRNLKGDEILMEARILAICDVVESIASHRPYRAALGIDAALQEIEINRGILYDADVVDTCLRLFREKGYQFE